ncbi:FAD binding domain-containing protein [Streptomyces sp. NPDC051366]|uniref:FAD binding domain-containing protein n=1 Tax=Streptomyces sp. NPDC051366 TaxID=3365652 RepID=UPI003794DB52
MCESGVYPLVFSKPATESAALAAGADGGRYIAGGTTLVDLMRETVERPSRLVDINNLPYRDVTVSSEGLRVGALVRMSELAANAAGDAGSVRSRCATCTCRFPVVSAISLATRSPAAVSRAARVTSAQNGNSTRCARVWRGITARCAISATIYPCHGLPPESAVLLVRHRIVIRPGEICSSGVRGVQCCWTCRTAGPVRAATGEWPQRFAPVGTGAGSCGDG